MHVPQKALTEFSAVMAGFQFLRALIVQTDLPATLRISRIVDTTESLPNFARLTVMGIGRNVSVIRIGQLPHQSHFVRTTGCGFNSCHVGLGMSRDMVDGSLSL